MQQLILKHFQEYKPFYVIIFCLVRFKKKYFNFFKINNNNTGYCIKIFGKNNNIYL